MPAAPAADDVWTNATRSIDLMTQITVVPKPELSVFDFYSKARMHLPFNEGYLRILRAAFPDASITFHADAEHLRHLEPMLAGLGVSLVGVQRARVPFGLSFHNPIGAGLAARRCLAAMLASVPTSVGLVAVLGFDAALYRLISQRWPRERGPVDLILHGSLAANYVWRSRNPLIRWWDLRSSLSRPVRSGVRVVGLELGVDAALVADFPGLAGSIDVLEHPVLKREWSETSGAGLAPISVGFLGFGSFRKGFDIFAGLAKTVANPAIAFDAIGHADDTPDLDISGLRRTLSATSLPRDVYVEGLRALDIVCLPLHGRSYEFAASGTVSDAIAALKPILAFRNRSLQAIWDRYGPIGRLFDTEAAMRAYLADLDPLEFAASRAIWVENLRHVRTARGPDRLAQTYQARAPQKPR